MSGVGAIGGVGGGADVTNPVILPPPLPIAFEAFMFGWDGSSALAPAVAAIGGSLASASIRLQTDLASARSVNSASSSTLQQIEADLIAPRAIAGPCLKAIDGIMGVVGAADKFAAGIDPYAMTLNVQNLVAAAGALPMLSEASNKLDRMAANLATLAAGT